MRGSDVAAPILIIFALIAAFGLYTKWRYAEREPTPTPPVEQPAPRGDGVNL